MPHCQIDLKHLKAYKQIQLNHNKNLSVFLKQHSTKEGTWAELTVHHGSIEFLFLDGFGYEQAHHTLTAQSLPLTIPPSVWHQIKETSDQFEATLTFYCYPHRYFEKKYALAPIHHDLWNIYQTYFDQRDIMNILDIGCGSGRNPLYFALAGHHVIGIDNNQQALDKIQTIAQQEQLLNITTYCHDLNHALEIKNQQFDFIYSTVALQFLHPENIQSLLTQLQSITAIGGMHCLILPIQTDPYDYPKSFSYLAQKEELYHFYQNNGWSIIEYTEKPGQLHKQGDSGLPRQGMFGKILAQKQF